MKRAFIAICLSFLAPTFEAQASEPLQQSNSTALWFDNWGTLTNATLTIITPDGTVSKTYMPSGPPVFYLQDVQPILDGVYVYELTAATDEKVAIKNPINNGRGENARNEENVPFQMNGSFVVSRGVISREEAELEEE